MFLSKGTQTWCSYDPQDNEVTVNPMPKAGDDDLLNVAVIETYTKVGRVYVLEEEEMPDNTEVAAVFRY